MAINWTYTDFNGIREMPVGRYAGVYAFKLVDNPENRILYIGRSIHLKGRLITHYPFLKIILSDLVKDGQLVVCYSLCENNVEVEKALIKTYNPPYNTLLSGWVIDKNDLLKRVQELEITEP